VPAASHRDAPVPSIDDPRVLARRCLVLVLSRRRLVALAMAIVVGAGATGGHAGTAGMVLDQMLIAGEEGGLGELGPWEAIGASVRLLDDLDGNGVDDLAVGSNARDVGGPVGRLRILFMSSEGTVLGTRTYGWAQEIDVAGPFDAFGASVEVLGDVDGNGVDDLAVGSPGIDPVDETSEVYVLRLGIDGSLVGHHHWDRVGEAGDLPEYGRDVENLGDLDGDGIDDLAVGAPGDGAGGVFQSGAVWIEFMAAHGWPRESRKLAVETEPLVAAALEGRERFGQGLACLGDVDGDGSIELVVTAPYTNVVRVLSLTADGSPAEVRVLRATDDEAWILGYDAASVGDLDGDGIPEVAIGAPFFDDGGEPDLGRVEILFLDADLTLREIHTLAEWQGGMEGSFPDQACFGSAVASIGDRDGDGRRDLAVGAFGWDDFEGAVWLLSLDGAPVVSVPPGAVPGRPGIDAHPNPSRGVVDIGLPTSLEAVHEALVIDATGRVVRHLDRSAPSAGGTAFVWDGRDDRGRSTAPGAYVIRVDTAGRPATRTIVRVR